MLSHQRIWTTLQDFPSDCDFSYEEICSRVSLIDCAVSAVISNRARIFRDPVLLSELNHLPTDLCDRLLETAKRLRLPACDQLALSGSFCPRLNISEPVDDFDLDDVVLLHPHVTEIMIADACRLSSRGLLSIAGFAASLSKLDIRQVKPSVDNCLDCITARCPNLRFVRYQREITPCTLETVATHCASLVYLSVVAVGTVETLRFPALQTLKIRSSTCILRLSDVQLPQLTTLSLEAVAMAQQVLNMFTLSCPVLAQVSLHNVNVQMSAVNTAWKEESIQGRAGRLKAALVQRYSSGSGSGFMSAGRPVGPPPPPPHRVPPPPPPPPRPVPRRATSLFSSSDDDNDNDNDSDGLMASGHDRTQQQDEAADGAPAFVTCKSLRSFKCKSLQAANSNLIRHFCPDNLHRLMVSGPVDSAVSELLETKLAHMLSLCLKVRTDGQLVPFCVNLQELNVQYAEPLPLMVLLSAMPHLLRLCSPLASTPESTDTTDTFPTGGHPLQCLAADIASPLALQPLQYCTMLRHLTIHARLAAESTADSVVPISLPNVMSLSVHVNTTRPRPAGIFSMSSPVVSVPDLGIRLDNCRTAELFCAGRDLVSLLQLCPNIERLWLSEAPSGVSTLFSLPQCRHVIVKNGSRDSMEILARWCPQLQSVQQSNDLSHRVTMFANLSSLLIPPSRAPPPVQASDPFDVPRTSTSELTADPTSEYADKMTRVFGAMSTAENQTRHGVVPLQYLCGTGQQSRTTATAAPAEPDTHSAICVPNGHDENVNKDEDDIFAPSAPAPSAPVPRVVKKSLFDDDSEEDDFDDSDSVTPSQMRVSTFAGSNMMQQLQAALIKRRQAMEAAHTVTELDCPTLKSLVHFSSEDVLPVQLNQLVHVDLRYHRLVPWTGSHNVVRARFAMRGAAISAFCAPNLRHLEVRLFHDHVHLPALPCLQTLRISVISDNDRPTCRLVVDKCPLLQHLELTECALSMLDVTACHLDVLKVDRCVLREASIEVTPKVLSLHNCALTVEELLKSSAQPERLKKLLLHSPAIQPSAFLSNDVRYMQLQTLIIKQLVDKSASRNKETAAIPDIVVQLPQLRVLAIDVHTIQQLNVCCPVLEYCSVRAHVSQSVHIESLAKIRVTFSVQSVRCDFVLPQLISFVTDHTTRLNSHNVNALVQSPLFTKLHIASSLLSSLVLDAAPQLVWLAVQGPHLEFVKVASAPFLSHLTIDGEVTDLYIDAQRLAIVPELRHHLKRLYLRSDVIQGLDLSSAAFCDSMILHTPALLRLVTPPCIRNGSLSTCLPLLTSLRELSLVSPRYISKLEISSSTLEDLVISDAGSLRTLHVQAEKLQRLRLKEVVTLREASLHAPNLTLFAMPGCVALDAQSVNQCICTLRNVQQMTLAGVMLDSDNISTIAHCTPQLLHLNISQSALEVLQLSHPSLLGLTANYLTLRHMALECNALTSLTLEGCEVDAQSVVQSVFFCPALTQLNMAGARIHLTLEQLDTVTSGADRICNDKLRVSATGLHSSDEAFAVLMTGLSAARHLQFTKLSGVTSCHAVINATSVSFDKGGLNSISLIAPRLAVLEASKMLHLQTCELHAPNLQTLDLSQNVSMTKIQIPQLDQMCDVVLNDAFVPHALLAGLYGLCNKPEFLAIRANFGKLGDPEAIAFMALRNGPQTNDAAAAAAPVNSIDNDDEDQWE